MLEIFAVSCLDKPGVDRVTNRPGGYTSRVLMMGSDSPSNSAAFVSCRRDELRCCKVSFGRDVVGMLGTLGLRRECLLMF